MHSRVLSACTQQMQTVKTLSYYPKFYRLLLLVKNSEYVLFQNNRDKSIVKSNKYTPTFFIMKIHHHFPNVKMSLHGSRIENRVLQTSCCPDVFFINTILIFHLLFHLSLIKGKIDTSVPLLNESPQKHKAESVNNENYIRGTTVY